jgi:hypothetical protein
VTFAKEQIEAKKQLEELCHTVLITDDIEHYANDASIKLSFNEELKLSLEFDIMRSFFNKIAESDGFLVMNYPKKGIPGYLGTSVLMEIGLAYYLRKKIYLLNPVDQSQNYALELAIIQPIIIDGDLTKIK